RYKFKAKDYVDDTSPHTPNLQAQKKDAQRIIRHMIEVWKLPAPDLIISIVGSEKPFEMAQRIRNEFQ
ncbi:unnamed protein product, partial [Didymodactylos carnosus]